MAEQETPPLLACADVRSGWDRTEVLSGIGFDLAAGETMAVLGRNGVGKTTLLSTLMGRARLRGTILYDGRDLAPLSIAARSHAGIALVPQEREIFRTLSVQENLQIAARKGGRWTLEGVYDLFPRLAERRRNMGGHLSGGEQQMLSIARALMTGPRLLMLDEPMEGLAPVIVDMLIAAIERIARESGIAVLLVEQHVRIALALSERCIVLDRGRIVYADGRGERPDRDRIEALIALRAAA